MALLVISGAAALIYQVVWVRLLGLSMGTTSVAVSSVVAAFFLGLALGSYAASLIRKDRPNLLRLYMILEIVIGLSGLLILPALLNLDKIMSLLPFWGTHLATKFLISVAILIIPTICMGATFPILALTALRSYQPDSGIVSELYAFNTIGAVLGVLSSGFILIPYLGLSQATYIACSLNMLAGFIAITGRNNSTTYSTINHPQGTVVRNPQNTVGTAWLGLVALFTMGMVSLGLQISWTQYLALFVGGTIYGFTAILGIFLVGISAGAWALHRVSGHLTSDSTTYLYLLLVFVGTLVFTRSALTVVPDITGMLKEVNVRIQHLQAAKYAVVLAFLFVPTFLMGVLFPIAMSIYSAGSKTDKNVYGLGYAVNTLGGIIGVVVVGLWLIPTFGTDKTLVILILLIIALIGIFIPALPRQQDKLVALVAVSFLLWQLFTFSGLSYQNMIVSNPYRFDTAAKSGKVPEFLYLKEGKSSIVSVITYENSIARIQNNGIQESYVSLRNDQPPPKAETLLGLLPYVLHSGPQSAFIIGYGGGHTTNALSSTPLDSIKVVELESNVIAAVDSVARHATAALRDARVSLEINDARNALLVNKSSYDLIISQPSHPWLSGAGNLFTKDFFNIVDSRLNAGGIFAQWINLFKMDTTTLLSILKAYYTIFPYGFTVALTETGDLLLLGSNTQIIFDTEKLNRDLTDTPISAVMQHWNITEAESIMSLFTLSRKQILQSSQHVSMNTDNRMFSEVRLANLVKDPTGESNPYNWISNTANRDMQAYFKTEDLAQTYYELGLHFQTNGQRREQQLIYERLLSLDSTLAKALKNSGN